MGSPEFGVPVLQGLHEERHEIAGVFCQPDKPKGRGNLFYPPPVKLAAQELGLKVYQPATLKSDESFELVKSLNPDLIVVAAYGKILPKRILDAPRFGCINIHASLLPKYRGAAPIQWAIIKGEKETGVTIMQMDEGIDTGDILLQEKIEIAAEDTSLSIHDKLAGLGREMIIRALKLLEVGGLTRMKQNHEEASYAPMLSKEMGEIDWTKSAEAIFNLVRGLHPWPGTYTFINGKYLKVFPPVRYGSKGKKRNPKCGEVMKTLEDGIRVECGAGWLDILEMQLESRRRMSAGDFLRGFKVVKGTVLGRGK